MESAGHSRLLKYLLPSSQIHTSKMSEPHSYKVKFDYKNPENIDAEVPNEQKLRQNDEIVIFEEDTFAPVMTVKKEEAAFTKGDMKLQKISVTENISESKNGGMYIVINPTYSTITGEVITGPQPLRQIDGNIQVSTEVDRKPIEEKKSRTRIPKFKQTVEKLQKQKREDERRAENEVPPSHISHKRRSSIPRLKGRKTASTVREPVNTNDVNANNVETVKIINNENANNTETNVETKPEDEFDKIYEQIVDDQQTEATNDMLIDCIEDPDELETSFEEIIHSYEEKPVVKSKIPLLKQKSLHDIKLPKKYDRRYSLKNGAVVGDNTVDNPLKDKEDLRPIESTVDVSKDIKDDTNSEYKKVIRNNEIIDEKEINNDIKETVNSLQNAAVVGDNTVDNSLKVKENLRPIESTIDVSKDIQDDTNSESTKIIRNNDIIDEKEINDDIKETINSLKNGAVAGDNTVDNSFKVKEDLRPIESDVDISKDIKDDIDRANEIIYEKSTNNDVKESVKVATPIFEDIENNDNRENLFIKPESVNSPNSDNNFEIPDSSKMVINIQAVTRSKDNPVDEIKKDTPEENEGYEIRKELDMLRERLSKRIKKFDSMEPISDAQKVDIPKRSISQVDQRDFKEPKDVPTEKVKTEFNTKYNQINSFIDIQNNIEKELDISEQTKTEIKIKHNKIEESIDIDNITEKGPIIDIKEKQTKYVPVHIKHKGTKIPDRTNKIITSDDVNNLQKGVDEDRNKHSPVLRGNVSKIINRLVSSDGVEGNKEKNDYVEPIQVKKSVSSRIAMFERQESETTSRPFETKIPKPKPRSNTHKPKIVDELLKSQENLYSKVNVTKEEIPLDPVFDDNLKAINNIENELNNLKEDVFVTKERIEASCEKDIITEENNNENIQIITENNEEREFEIADDAIKSNLINDAELLNNDFKPTDNKIENNLQLNNEIKTPKHEIIKNEFRPKDNKVQNELNTIDSSKEKNNGAFTKTPMLTIEDRLKRMTSHREEEMKRSKSVAELDVGDTIKGKVHRMIVTINSIEKIESEKKEINVKERPRKRSVSEKIALFEKKLTPARMEETTTTEKTTKVETKPVEPTVSDEVFNEKIAELTNAKTKYGRMDDMIYLKLRNGADMPVLAVGTALVHPRLLPHVIGAAIDLGYRAFDTAYIYGNEKEVGQAIRAKIDDGTVQREDLFISSKLWSTFHRQDLVETACRSSLEAMGLEYFDLFMIHNPMSFLEGGDPIPTIANVLQFSTSDYLDAWFGMEELVTKGLVRSIGVSNFNSEQIARVTEKARVKPVINQVECHPYLTQERLDQFCGDREIKLNCFGVLGSKGTPDEYKNNLLPVIEDPLIKCMAAGLKITPAQLLIRYQIERGHSAVVKSSSASHLWENLQSLTITLSQIQVDALNALNRNKRTFAFKGMGDTHKNYPFKIPF